MAAAANRLSNAPATHSLFFSMQQLPASKSLQRQPMPIDSSKKLSNLSFRITRLSPAFNGRSFFKIASLAQGAPLTTQQVPDAAEQEEGREGQGTQSNPLPTNKVYVGNLPWSCDAAELTEIFRQCGTVETAEVVIDKETGRSRGFAFVTMATVEGAQAAIEKLNGIELGGRAMRVSFPEKLRKPAPDRRMGEVDSGIYVDSPHKIYVGNLAWTVNSSSLREFFNEKGNVLGAKVVYQTDTGGSCGYGFVSFSSQTDAEAAIASFDGKELEGRAVYVKAARKAK